MANHSLTICSNSAVVIPACVARRSSTKFFSLAAAAVFKIIFKHRFERCSVFHSGCCGARAFTRSMANASCVYIGCSVQSVPSLSNVAMR